MFIQSAIIYFNEEPVGYDLYVNEETFRLQPAVATEAIPPSATIQGVKTADGWVLSGNWPPDVAEQVQGLLLASALLPEGKLTAAS